VRYKFVQTDVDTETRVNCETEDDINWPSSHVNYSKDSQANISAEIRVTTFSKRIFHDFSVTNKMKIMTYRHSIFSQINDTRLITVKKIKF